MPENSTSLPSKQRESKSPWPQTLKWFGYGLSSMLGIMSLALWITGLFPYFYHLNSKTYSAGYALKPSEAPELGNQPERKLLENCEGAAISGSVLLLKCGGTQRSATATLEGVALLPVSNPLGEAARKTLDEIINKHKGMVDSCRPAHLGYECEVEGLDLRVPLLAAGLAIRWPRNDGPARSETEKLLKRSEEQARYSRIGLWWDWEDKGGSEPDPILRRMALDQSSSEQLQVSRAQAFAGFFSAALTGFLGLLSGYVFTRHEKLSRVYILESYAAKKVERKMLEITRSLTSFQQTCVLYTTTSDDLSQELKRFVAAADQFEQTINDLLEKTLREKELSTGLIKTWERQLEKVRGLQSELEKTMGQTRPRAKVKEDVEELIDRYLRSLSGTPIEKNN